MKISSYIECRKEYEHCCNAYIWKAYFRGTNNRVHYENGLPMQGYSKLSHLRFALLNNKMERGVLTDN